MDVADAAIDRLHEKGWSRGRFTNASGQHCLVGAVMYAVPMRKGVSYKPQRAELYEALVRVIPVDYACGTTREQVMRWNDCDARDADDVIEKLKLARELLASEQ